MALPVIRTGGLPNVNTPPGGSSLNIKSIISKLRKAQEEANAANEQRYAEGLEMLTQGRSTLQSLFSQAAEDVKAVGQTAFGDIDRGAQRQQAAGRQHLISSGLANTTIQGTMSRGVEEDRRRSMERVENQQRLALGDLAQRRAGAEFATAGTISDFIAGRNDVGPDPALYGSLLQAAAAQPQQPVQGAPVHMPMTGARDYVTGSGYAGGGYVPGIGHTPRGHTGMVGGGAMGGGIQMAMGAGAGPGQPPQQPISRVMPGQEQHMPTFQTPQFQALFAGQPNLRTKPMTADVKRLLAQGAVKTGAS